MGGEFSKHLFQVFWKATARGVPAHTQSTQLRTLIFESPKNKNVLNREKCNKNMPHPGGNKTVHRQDNSPTRFLKTVHRQI